MIEEFVSRILILALGYAYPAFQCFKTIEKNKVGIQELRFWCQYWIIIAVLTVLEIFLDLFISWLPLYRGIKLTFFIYLWHPSTKGSGYIYEKMLQPYVARHETKIDRRIAELKERAWNLVLSYWYNFADIGSKKAMQCFQFMLAQCMNVSLQRPEPQSQPQPQPQQSQVSEAEGDKELNEAPTPTPPSTPSAIFKRNVSEKRRPPLGTSPLHRSLTATRSESFNKINIRNQTQFIHMEGIENPNSDRSSELGDKPDSSDHNLLAARVKLRQVKSSKNV